MPIFLIILCVSVLAISLIFIVSLVISYILEDKKRLSANPVPSTTIKIIEGQVDKTSQSQKQEQQPTNSFQEENQLINFDFKNKEVLLENELIKKAEAAIRETRVLLETNWYIGLKFVNKVINFFTLNYFSEKLIQVPQALIISYLDQANLCLNNKDWKDAINLFTKLLPLIDYLEFTNEEGIKLKENLNQIMDIFIKLKSNFINPKEQQEDNANSVTTGDNSSSNETLRTTPSGSSYDREKNVSQVAHEDIALASELAKKDVEIFKLKLEINEVKCRVISLETEIEILNKERENERLIHNLRFLYQMENVNLFQRYSKYSPQKIWVSNGIFFRPVNVDLTQDNVNGKSEIFVEEVNDDAIDYENPLLTSS